eukprot:sb/3468176/
MGCNSLIRSDRVVDYPMIFLCPDIRNIFSTWVSSVFLSGVEEFTECYRIDKNSMMTGLLKERIMEFPFSSTPPLAVRTKRLYCVYTASIMRFSAADKIASILRATILRLYCVYATYIMPRQRVVNVILFLLLFTITLYPKCRHRMKVFLFLLVAMMVLCAVFAEEELSEKKKGKRPSKAQRAKRAKMLKARRARAKRVAAAKRSARKRAIAKRKARAAKRRAAAKKAAAKRAGLSRYWRTKFTKLAELCQNEKEEEEQCSIQEPTQITK